MIRSLFLYIIPKNQKDEIAKERHLVDDNYMRLADSCRSRTPVLQHETLSEIVKKTLTSFSRGKVNVVKPTPGESDSEVPPPLQASHLAPDVPAWTQFLIAAITQRLPKKPRTDDTRGGKDEHQATDHRRNRPSPGRNLVGGWGSLMGGGYIYGPL